MAKAFWVSAIMKLISLYDYDASRNIFTLYDDSKIYKITFIDLKRFAHNIYCPIGLQHVTPYSSMFCLINFMAAMFHPHAWWYTISIKEFYLGSCLAHVLSVVVVVIR
jgi:hypothetical protein